RTSTPPSPAVLSCPKGGLTAGLGAGKISLRGRPLVVLPRGLLGVPIHLLLGVLGVLGVLGLLRLLRRGVLRRGRLRVLGVLGGRGVLLGGGVCHRDHRGGERSDDEGSADHVAHVGSPEVSAGSQRGGWSAPGVPSGSWSSTVLSAPRAGH